MGTCGATCGITRERDRQKSDARALVLRAFPDGFAREPAWVPPEAAFAWDEADVVARALEEVLPCRAVVLRGDGRRADWIHLVATLDARSWLALREGAGEAPERPSETCLRVGLSPWGRYATLQEVRLSGARDGDGWWIEEERVAGVEDRRLQHFVKAVQGFLRKRKVVSLDAAFLDEPVEDPRGEGASLAGVSPTLWSVLFDPEPMVARAGVWVTS